MIKGVPQTLLGSIWYHPEPSDVFIAVNFKRTFGCHRFDQKNNEFFFKDFCPNIKTKIVSFWSKRWHQVLLKSSDLYYWHPWFNSRRSNCGQAIKWVWNSYLCILLDFFLCNIRYPNLVLCHRPFWRLGQN